jgi:transcriptional regulator with XRE-family HTH domain
MARHQLGAELRRLREAMPMRLSDAADRVEVAASTLSRIETGKMLVRASYLTVLLDLYGITDDERRQALAALAREGRGPAWWTPYRDVLPPGMSTYLGLELAAARISIYATRTVPQLAQITGYVQADCATDTAALSHDQISGQVAVTMRRQEHVLGRLPLCLIIDESALLRPVGSPEVMNCQYEHLLRLSACPLVTIQVARLGDLPAGYTPPFAVLDSADAAGNAVAWPTGLHGHITVSQHDSEQHTARRRFAALADAAMSRTATIDFISELADPIRQVTATSRTARNTS